MPVPSRYSNLSYKNRFDAKNKDFLDRNFHKSDAYYVVKVINLLLDSIENVPIHIYNFTTKANESKRFMTHPDFNYIDVGYIIEKDLKKYLITNIESHGELNKFGMIKECNSELKWKDSYGTIYTTPAVIETKRGMGDNNFQIQMVTNTLDVYLPNNPITSRIFINQRFIFNNKWAYRVNFINDMTHGGMILLNLEFEEVKENDDLVNNIAYVEQTDENLVDTINGIYFSKTELNVKVGFTETLSIYKYVNSVKQADTFTFEIDGIPSGAYEMAIIDGNNISIKCLDFVHSGSVVANSNTDMSEHTIPIKLTGIF